ncbi:hypothetical protein RCL1_007395 [Eukaryota sp. TZLM3-RCL]
MSGTSSKKLKRIVTNDLAIKRGAHKVRTVHNPKALVPKPVALQKPKIPDSQVVVKIVNDLAKKKNKAQGPIIRKPGAETLKTKTKQK